ncbi:MAG TPA: nucleotidyltransferase domain-containing protein [Rhodanobacteraceae bacterium]
MIDLSEQHHQLVSRILHRRFPDRQARIFGSRANGSAKPWSDLDLVILGSQPVNDLALAEARADFEESDLPFRVDLNLWCDLPDSMQQTINRSSQAL